MPKLLRYDWWDDNLSDDHDYGAISDQGNTDDD